MNTKRNALRAVVALASLSAMRCSDAREACMSSSWNGAHTSKLYVDTLTEAVLSADNPHVDRQLSLTLSGLPKLWAPAGAIVNAHLTLAASWSYLGLDSPPVGLEYPRLQLQFDNTTQTAIETTPTETKKTVRVELFDADCDDAGAPCCPYGSRECTADLRLSVDQARAGTFPDLQLKLQFWSEVTVDNCPLEDNKPQLQLLEVMP